MSQPTSADWQALPVSAVAVLFFSGLLRFVRENIFIFVGAGTGFAVSEALGWRELGLAAALIVLMGMLIAMIYHRRFRYQVDAESMRVRKGLFEQKELKVRFERVQNVGFSQPLYLRPLGLIRLNLDTPGALQAEVSLPGVGLEEAARIRDLVARHRRTDEPEHTDTREPDDTALFAPTASDLFKYGLTSNQIWLYLAIFAGPITQQIERRLSQWVEGLIEAAPEQFEAVSQAPLALALVAGLSVIMIAALIMTLSGVLAMVRFHGYRLEAVDQRFVARFGSLDAREKTLRRSRLHSHTQVQTAVGRWLGQWHVIGHQTGVSAHAMNGEDRRFLIPGIDSVRVPELMRLLAGSGWHVPGWNPISARFRRIHQLRFGSILGFITIILCRWVFGTGWWVALALALILVVLIALLAHWRWRRWGWYCDGRRIQIRSGLVGQSITGFDLERCQQVRVKSSPYQRRHALASLEFRLPHGDVELPYLPRRTADELANLALYKAETAWLHAL